MPYEQIVVEAQFRATFVEIEALAASIEQDGQLQPVIVRAKEDALVLVAGERRYRAVGVLRERYPGDPRFQSLFAVVRDDISDAEARIVQLIENIQRDDLKPLEEARAVVELIAERDITQDDAARLLGKSTRWVSDRVNLLRLPDDLKAEVDSGVLGMTRALKVAKETPEKRQRSDHGGEPSPRTIALPASLVVSLAQRMAALAEQQGGEPIHFGNRATHKDYRTAIESRLLEVLDAAIKR